MANAGAEGAGSPRNAALVQRATKLEDRTGREQGATMPGRHSIVGSLLAAVVALGVADTALAASSKRVGWLEVCGPGPTRPHFDIFRSRLAEHGYVEGRNVVIEQRFADCHYQRMAPLA